MKVGEWLSWWNKDFRMRGDIMSHEPCYEYNIATGHCQWILSWKPLNNAYHYESIKSVSFKIPPTMPNDWIEKFMDIVAAKLGFTYESE
ncbi:MAG: hypothetical protein ACXABY_16530 [Candidatus Thorarchaeota archaeon]|jgi:hypothetical protein